MSNYPVGLELGFGQTIMRNGLRLLAFLLLATGSIAYADQQLPYYDTPEFTPRWIEADSPDLATFHRIPDFAFTNQNGASISSDSVDGKVYVASFFFSTCPGICPAIRSKLATVQKAFSGDDAVRILSHSIRPATDTVEVLRRYADHNGIQDGQWHLLTGDKEKIYELARSAYFANEDLGNIKDLVDFLHTENLLLIDQNRHIRGIYNGLSSSSVSDLIADIKSLRAQ